MKIHVVLRQCGWSLGEQVTGHVGFFSSLYNIGKTYVDLTLVRMNLLTRRRGVRLTMASWFAAYGSALYTCHYTDVNLPLMPL